MTKPKKCLLCGEHSTLLKGHVIPKFAVNWLKRTSATGYLRQAVKPNLPRQDTDKLRLLCPACEARFSRWEKLFAENIFVPFQESGQKSFQYEEWFLYFAVSLAWRTVVRQPGSLRKDKPKLAIFVEKALEFWRAFLLGDSSNPGPYEHHIFFLDFVASANGLDLPDKFHWYLMRSFDSTIAHSSKQVLAYTKLPSLIFWSGIEPPKVEGWENSLISREGTMKTPQRVVQPGFGEFLFNRAKIAMEEMSKVSQRQHNRIMQAALKDPERTFAPRPFEVYLADKFWHEQKNKKR